MTKISQMLAAQSLLGDELVEVVQDGVNKKVSAQTFFGKSAYASAVAGGYVGDDSSFYLK